MSAFANPVFPRIDPTSNPAGSALNRVSRLDYALTKNAPATPLESTLTKAIIYLTNHGVSDTLLTKLLDLKSFRFRSYKKHPGGPFASYNGSRSAAEVETKKRGGKEAWRRSAPLGGDGGWKALAWDSTKEPSRWCKYGGSDQLGR